MKRLVLAAMVLGLAAISVTPGSAQAQAAVTQAAPAKVSEVREVYPRDLMTFRERFDMWRAMRNARTMDEKMELWAAKYAELEKRAAEKGVRLKEMGPMMMSNGGGHDGQRGPAGENGHGQMRIGMGGGGMHAQPPMGR